MTCHMSRALFFLLTDSNFLAFQIAGLFS